MLPFVFKVPSPAQLSTMPIGKKPNGHGNNKSSSSNSTISKSSKS